MKENSWDGYINEILSFVKFRYDHKAIRRELTEHMEDLQETLMAEGLDETAAAYMTVEYMGEAAEIGQALDQEHHALLGWVWRISRVLAILLILLTFSDLHSFFYGMVRNSFEQYEPQSESAELWHMELDREYQVYADTLILEDVYYYEDGTMAVVYRTKYNPFDTTIDWGNTIGAKALDAGGESVSVGGGGFKQGGYNGIGWNTLNEVPADAKKLQISCSHLVVTVDLETGEVTDNAET